MNILKLLLSRIKATIAIWKYKNIFICGVNTTYNEQIGFARKGHAYTLLQTEKDFSQDDKHNSIREAFLYSINMMISEIINEK